MKSIYIKSVEFFDANAYQIDEIYAEKLLMDISTIIPIKDDNNILFFKGGNAFEENKFIKEFIGKEYKIYKEKNDIYRFIQGLKGQLEVKLYNLVLQNPIGYLISLYRMLDYNSQFTPLVMEAINKDIDEIEFKDENIRILASSINLLKKQANESKFKKILGYIENIIAIDKQSLQKVVNYILAYKFEYSDANIQAVVELEELIEVARGIYRILSIKHEIFSNIENITLKIDNGEIIISVEEPILKTISGDFYDVLSNNLTNNFKFDDKVNEVMREFIGIDSITINNAINRYTDGENEYPGMMFFDEEGLLMFLESFFSIDTNSAKKIKKELVLDKLKVSKIRDDVSLDEGRLMRQSILELNEGLYICSEPIFIFSLGGIIADIADGNISNEEFKGKLFKYIHEMHIEFEKDVESLIGANSSCQLLNRGVHETFFKEFKLPGEIDILVIIKGVLFVIECKAFSLQFNLSGMLSEVKKVKGTSNKKSIQQKLKAKVDTLKENKHIVESVVGLKIDKIEGVIITKNPSIAFEANMGFFDVIHSSQILNYIKDRT
ncbi:NERD domain-containing protein [Lysinibacillus fusiformis]|uniref:NERD domain-containing protein n=1 Tax=Lysinibacillus fusiformis TaxID=28031 RepID=UPI003796D874